MSGTGKEKAGYLIGFIVFICGIPFFMFLLAGRIYPGAGRMICCIVLAAAGIGLSVWSIVYMKRVGQGNPLDAFDHEIGPRTKKLMTDGPYRICRNPMLLGVFIFYAGLQILLLSWKALLLFAIFVLIMLYQVKKEEQRLERDFGREYLEYKKKTPALLPAFNRFKKH